MIKAGLLGILAFVLSVSAPFLNAFGDNSQKVVVELYTSQGCSSCPPAEAFIHELAKRDNVIALEFHVDYWDYIGWHDPFAKPAFTNRQRAYVRNFGERYVYTPQMIIDGANHVAGSRKQKVERAILRARDEKPADQPEIILTQGSDGLEVTVKANRSHGKTYEINLISFDQTHETQVTRGENSGKILRNARVVRSIEKIGTWNGSAFQQTVDLASLKGNGGCALLVQETGSGRVLTAAQLLFPESSS